MLELGQPTHPYDLDRLGGRCHRRSGCARPGEVLVTLDGTSACSAATATPRPARSRSRTA